MKRKRYLEKKPLEETRQLLLSKLRPFIEAFLTNRLELVTVADALHRITAEPVFAKMSSPHYHAAAMDGLAVSADLTFGATERRPKRLRLGTEAHPVDTGNPIPRGANAVIMIEEVHFLDDDTVELDRAVHPWQNVRVVGEDVVTGEMILPENHRIHPYDMGALMAGGVWTVCVRQRPRVAVIPTGSELVEPGSPLKAGDIIEFNSTILKGLLSEDGAEYFRSPIVPDDYEALRATVVRVLEDFDVALMVAGSSAGSQDHTFRLLDELGEVLAHGVSIMPGKPTILSLVDGKPVIGLPGYPVSAVIAYEQFVRPLIFTLLCSGEATRRRVTAVPAMNIPSKLGVDEFLRVRLGKIGAPLIATPLPRGAGVITSLSKADGIIRIPSLSEGVTEGEEVEVELLRDEEAIVNRLIMVGSHDLIIDILATHLSRKYPHISLASAHVGSMGGLIAIRNGRAHLAGTHLLDPETGEYNLPYIARALNGLDVHVIQLVLRQQGLIIASGNPKGIRGVDDLTREGVAFVNRQRGSGTRVLLDHLLREHRIRPEAIRGYEREESTHMAVAVAVSSGSADAGVGIYAAAKALGLFFVPLTMERYDLVIPDVFFHDANIQALLEVVGSEAFQRSVKELGGYDVSRMGEPIPLA